MRNKDLATFRADVLHMTQQFLGDTIEDAKNTVARRERSELPMFRMHVFALLGVHSVLNAGETPDELYAAAVDRFQSLIRRHSK